MSRLLRGALLVLIAFAGVFALLLFFAARDDSTLDSARPLGKPYTGEPVLSPALEDAIAKGNVVVLHRDARPPKGIRDLQVGAGPELDDYGLAVLLEREPTLEAPLAAVSRDRIQEGNSAAELRDFVDFALK